MNREDTIRAIIAAITAGDTPVDRVQRIMRLHYQAIDQIAFVQALASLVVAGDGVVRP